MTHMSVSTSEQTSFSSLSFISLKALVGRKEELLKITSPKNPLEVKTTWEGFKNNHAQGLKRTFFS